MSKRIIVIGGGTFEPIRNHLSLAAPAFGKTAREIHNNLGGELFLTKMCHSQSTMITNKDVEDLIDDLIKDETVGTIVMNAALCDYKALPIDENENGWHGKRLKTSEGGLTLSLTPTDKLIGKIRKARPDIFLVGFKTTTYESSENQFLIALKMMKKSKCNLVLANDTVTRNNMIITPEETIYGETTNREDVINELCDMIRMRQNLTYHRGEFFKCENRSFEDAPVNFKSVMKFLINNGGYIENNGNGFTPGHFCYRNRETTDGRSSFVSSQRLVNHNDVIKNGMTYVHVKESDNTFSYYGDKKASVGARSQYLLLKENSEYDFIIHTHNPLKEGSVIPTTPQKPFQCGSIECGVNTLNNLGTFQGGAIKAVYLEKHGINLMFTKWCTADTVIEFLKDNIELGIKIK
jgi:hypothetical protein|tara:strand:- start:5712 stop:6932 length:1221 start_codon:yes stop_codon:yes gene_type:complete